MNIKSNIGTTLTLAGLLFGGMTAFVSGAVIPSLPFEDHFENGVLANSDTIVDAWTNINSGTGGLLTESSNRLNFSLTAANQFRYMQTSVSPAMNFYSEPVTYSLNGVNFTTPSSASTEYFLNMFVGVDGTAAGLGGNSDGIWVRARADGAIYAIGKKNGGSNYNLIDPQLGAWSGTLTALSLTMNGENFTINWTSTGSGSNSISGTTGITESDWSATGSTFAVHFQTTNNGGVTYNLSGSIDDISVIPEPSTMGMMGMAVTVLGVFLFRRRLAK